MDLSIVDILKDSGTLSDVGLRELLTTSDVAMCEALREASFDVLISNHGHIVKARGLIEISNICKNNCLYCGIRAANSEVERYRLTKDDILQCCAMGDELGFQTFVLQGGEDRVHTIEWIEDVVHSIRMKWSSTAITLSLGERTEEDYRRWFEAGANRYLLRHETATASHYSQLHPSNMSFESRMSCIDSLKRVGYETGVGMMVGAPYQTVEHLIADLRFMERVQPEMIGIGPFVPHHQSPFAHEKAGSVDLTLRLLSILRLMHPKANIPATTALGTLAEDGRTLGVLAGANVVMPNLSPLAVREKYALYDNKICTDLEAAESRYLLEQKFGSIGFKLV